HLLFDVCADDHCQRYQGLQQATTPQVKEALRSTRGIVLAHEEEICDARFYKCCGGLSEHFESCWSDSPIAYLKSIYDHASTRAKAQDLRNEAQARAFILSSPPAFCNTRNQEVLQQVLNDYDQETADFYRWNVHYDVDELSAIVRERSGIDFGRIQALIPVQRGASARLVKLKIVGEKRSLIVGKELEIRKFLSRTHLYSSAFVVDECRDPKGNLTGFNLQGAGWGHGVGLCQIGAAMMSEQGYQHKEILQHYYPQAQLLQLY
ncbi:MAG: SpoIID/LytB domain-containing protein, partial [Bacteroidales bacterium]|nr:SpoIID/LytB domain-containing protein [Bacteroidales bacterium]